MAKELPPLVFPPSVCPALDDDQIRAVWLRDDGTMMRTVRVSSALRRQIGRFCSIRADTALRSAGVIARRSSLTRERALSFSGSVLVLLVIAISGCGEPAEDAPPKAPPPPAALYQIDWLRLTDSLNPEQWLASREAKRDLSEDDPAVIAMRQKLEVAGRRFRDNPRMIANRAVQLEGMLNEKSISERAPRLIDALSDIPGETRYVESFSALCQQYYNLRTEGLDQAQALKTLKRRGDKPQ